MSDGTFTKSSGFISHINLVKRPYKMSVLIVGIKQYDLIMVKSKTHADLVDLKKAAIANLVFLGKKIKILYPSDKSLYNLFYHFLLSEQSPRLC